MSLLGKIVEETYPSTSHQYCTDHNLQLTAMMALLVEQTANMALQHMQVQPEMFDVVATMHKTKALVLQLRHSTKATNALNEVQRQLNSKAIPLCGMQETKTRWWSTYAMI
jgi:hypothetical protein